jgi:hypothetical protein
MGTPNIHFNMESCLFDQLSKVAYAPGAGALQKKVADLNSTFKNWEYKNILFVLFFELKQDLKNG